MDDLVSENLSSGDQANAVCYSAFETESVWDGHGHETQRNKILRAGGDVVERGGLGNPGTAREGDPLEGTSR